MPTIDEQKSQEILATPLFLFECTLRSGTVERWSSHNVVLDGDTYAGRVLSHNLFSLQLGADDGLDAAQKVVLNLANADSHFSQLERNTGFKGAQVLVRFVFFDLESGVAVSETRTVFRGSAHAPDEITESALRLAFSSKLNLQRTILPEVRIERRCPWTFPSTPAQRLQALDGGPEGKYSAIYRCGYSADQSGGAGNLNGLVPFESCDYTRASCEARGMFSADDEDNSTRRFGGLEFVPSQILVRSNGEKGNHLSPVVANEARYNDYVPLVYGTAWYKPPIIFLRNDGNLTHVEVLLGMGEIEDVVKAVVNGVEIPEAVDGQDMTATGWFRLVTAGSRTGEFNLDFADGLGAPLGDPYGSMAMLSIVVPNQVNSGQVLPKVNVLVKGLRLDRFDTSGASLGEAFTNNPAWILLDVLRRAGWQVSEIDVPSFALAAARCEDLVATTDLYGSATFVPRFQCNLVIQSRRSAADVIKGIRSASTLMLTYGIEGLLSLRLEDSISAQQPIKPEGSNSMEPLNGGWPAYEFSDGTAEFSGILRRANDEPSIRLWSRGGGDTPNRLTIEFQDEFNEYQQDSLALVDFDDAILTRREVTASFAALGLPNFDQATRVLRLNLKKTSFGNTFVEFDTTVRGIGLFPGDLITITYAKEGLDRQAFRIVKVTPEQNYGTVRIVGQWHDDAWYSEGATNSIGGRRRDGGDGVLPRPLTGGVIDADGIDQFDISETVIEGAAGTAVELGVSFITPSRGEPTSAAIPIVGINPLVQPTGGSIEGGQTLYYALAANSSLGSESPLSFIVRARVSVGSSTHTVTLQEISFNSQTTNFNVYRGTNPSELLRIATEVSVSSSFTDTGLVAQLLVPADPNYDHANIYWRRELQPEVNAETASATTVENSALGMVVDGLIGSTVRIMRGPGTGQERRVTQNTQTALTVSPAWNVIPSATSFFTVTDSAWNFGSVGTTSPVKFQVPNWGGQTVQISGRSANALDQESPYELNPLTRWEIGSSGTGGIDSDVPPLPTFALAWSGQGTIDLTSITFPTLANTNTINSGTLTVYHWNELTAPNTLTLIGAIDDSETALTLDSTNSIAVNDFIQIDEEILLVTDVQKGGIDILVGRAAHESVAASHLSGSLMYHLHRSSVVVPFAMNMFGTPASENYVHSVYIPDVRIGAAEFNVTNSIGAGLSRHLSYGTTEDGGLRTLSGGQVTLQVEGYLGVQTDAAPPFVVESTHAVRDITAVVREAPAGGALQLRVRQDAMEYCILTIADGDTASASVSGFGLPALTADSHINLDVIFVPGAPNTLPGRDLTVTIRF